MKRKKQRPAQPYTDAPQPPDSRFTECDVRLRYLGKRRGWLATLPDRSSGEGRLPGDACNAALLSSMYDRLVLPDGSANPRATADDLAAVIDGLAVVYSAEVLTWALHRWAVGRGLLRARSPVGRWQRVRAPGRVSEAVRKEAA